MEEENFNQIYEKIVDADSEFMESARKEAKKEDLQNSLIFVIILLINIIINCLFYKFTKVFSFELIGGFITISTAIFIEIKRRGGKSKIEHYQKEFKEKVIGTMVKLFNKNFEFTPSEGLPSEAYDEGEFEKYDRYNSEDLIKGKLNNGCKFEMSEILIERRDIGQDSKDKYTTVFNGLLAKVETPKPFDSCLYVRDDVKDKNFFARILSGKLPFDDLRIKLNPKEFEKMFDVYTSNQDVVMKLFTTEVKQMLMKFENDMKMTFEITIKNSHMYIRFHCGKMFETAKLSKHSLDRDTLFKYYKMIEFSYELTNMLVDILNKE